jgi:hypothetical protein
MRLLIDECLPRALKRLLAEHTCRTVQEMGWAGKKNGLLLSLADREFEVLITMDQGFEYQQKLRLQQVCGGRWPEPVLCTLNYLRRPGRTAKLLCIHTAGGFAPHRLFDLTF